MSKHFVLFYESESGNHDHFCFFSDGDAMSSETNLEIQNVWRTIGWKPNCYSIYELVGGWHVDYFKPGHKVEK